MDSLDHACLGSSVPRTVALTIIDHFEHYISSIPFAGCTRVPRVDTLEKIFCRFERVGGCVEMERTRLEAWTTWKLQ